MNDIMFVGNNLIGDIKANQNSESKKVDFLTFKFKIKEETALRYLIKQWLDKEKEERESEERERSEPRGLPRRGTPEPPSKASPNPPSADLPEEEESRGSHPSSMTTPDTSSRDSLRVLSEMPSPTPSTPEERPSPLWTSSTLSRDKAELSTVSEVDLA